MGLPPLKDRGVAEQLQKIDELWHKFQAEIDRSIEEGPAPTALYPASVEILKEMNKGVKMMEQDAAKALVRLRNISLVFFFISLVIAYVSVRNIRTKIITELQRAVAVSNSIKEGDLTVKIGSDMTDEIGDLQNSMTTWHEAIQRWEGA